ncbi:putative pentatricopeptide repeat-containing protein At3g15930 [Magnolia sinica]|uniref:putative pentatricopeptide repeat-containing protein At3g15930 n=1 Tax=Magnolia sinica TaxID=86752 RepID=UPI00265955B5|nr:putative pentatricopeptide repeat-containing protein At3g15930 [Magnolia sinica]
MNRTNCNSLLQSCKSLQELKQIHAQTIAQGLQHLQQLSCKILNSYTRFNQTTDAHMVFHQIRNPDIVSWTSLISLYLQIDRPQDAFSIFSQIISSGLIPDRFVIVGALSACGRKEDLGCGKLVHGMIHRYELGSDTIVDNALIDMYCRNGKIQMAHLVFSKMVVKDVVSWTSMLHGHIKCKDLESACRVFDKMPVRNAVSWTALITGYIQGGKPIGALELFHRMKSVGEAPTAITIVGVLSACADIGALDLGRSIHGYINKTDMSLNTTVGNALIDTYSKSGSVGMAEKVFENMSKKDVYSWTTMISGFAAHGNGNRAIQAFSEMLHLGLRPNEITFVAVLSACSHSGLIDEGRRWFDQMRESHNLKPNIQHYGCMVDLLGRSGLLNEAQGLIENMQMDPDAIIWRSLLSACLVQGNVELAEMAGKKILELEPDDDGVYILLWNLYAAASRWKEALEMRKLMKDRRVRKRPGSSWIEVNGVVHEFFVEDKMHHLRKEIYLVLQGITQHLKLD